MTERKKNRPISLKLYSTVFVVILILNILSIIGTLGMSSISRNQMLKEYEYALKLFVNQLDTELTTCQNRLYNLAHSYTYSVAISDENSELNQLDILVNQTELNSTLNEWINQFNMIDGYFIYVPEKDLLISSGQDSKEVMAITKQLENGEIGSSAGQWKIEKGENYRFLFCTEYHNSIYGAWVQCEKLFGRWGIDSQNTGNYEILSRDGETGSGNIEVGSENFNYKLSCQTGSSESLVPLGVKILLAASIIMLLALPFVWVRMRRLVIIPLRKLEKAIQKIESGDTSCRIQEASTSSEFDRLNRQFNSSMDQLAGMKMQIYESELEKERVYINYLSQQMQPHFVLNTLNLIFSMEPDEYDLIQSTVACLSDYYRYVAHIQKTTVPLSAEISHVENYFKLQQIRYPEMFEYEITCPEELKNTMVPPIIVQTFAENAIKHSMVVGEKNKVSIKIENADKNRIHIMIRDYGKGYPQEILDKILLFKETGEQQEGLGIGIQNTIERIKLIYQSQADISFENADDGGAMINLFIPVKEALELFTEKKVLEGGKGKNNEDYNEKNHSVGLHIGGRYVG